MLILFRICDFIDCLVNQKYDFGLPGINKKKKKKKLHTFITSQQFAHKLESMWRQYKN